MLKKSFLGLFLFFATYAYADICKIDTPFFTDLENDGSYIEKATIHKADDFYCENCSIDGQNIFIDKTYASFVCGKNIRIFFNNEKKHDPYWMTFLVLSGENITVSNNNDDFSIIIHPYPSTQTNKNSNIYFEHDKSSITLLYIPKESQSPLLKGDVTIKELHINEDPSYGFEENPNYMLNLDIKSKNITLAREMFFSPCAPSRGGFHKIYINSVENVYLEKETSYRTGIRDCAGDIFEVGIIDVETKDGAKPDLYITRGYLGSQFSGNINYNAFDNVYLKYNILTDLTEDIFTKDKEFFNANNIHRCYVEQKEEIEEATLQTLQKYNIFLCKGEILTPQKPDNLE